MSTSVITFFNNKGGVGKTSLVYHLSWMFAEMGWTVVAVDLDPQANLTAGFLDEDQLEELWNDSAKPNTIYRAIQPLNAVGDLLTPIVIHINSKLHLVPGDVALSGFEETLWNAWPASMGDNDLYRPFRILTAFWQVAQKAAKGVNANLVLVDVGPNLGAINRSALIASDFVVIPLGADLFSLQGLQNLGPTLRRWRNLWKKRLENWMAPEFDLPNGGMQPLGYIVQQHSERLNRPVKAYDRWMKRIPDIYRESVIGELDKLIIASGNQDCLGTLKHYHSLMPLSHEARKPIFNLTSSDKAIAGHANAARNARNDFRELAGLILKKKDHFECEYISKKIISNLKKMF